MLNHDIGLKLSLRRKELRLSQEELSKKVEERGLSLSREVISNIEQGKRIINIVEMNVFMDVLDMDINTFLHEEDDTDLVTLFRQKESLDTEDEWFLEDLQMIAAAFIGQKKML
ncbi:helix-turn-helix domain-containing protein [Bacillus cereus]|uniref:helix-turn-helix domain-containing protein n=1 Tax=Bacillus cereus TaxID=1396 RepID=UPI000BF36B78|nr:helix-turn-helix domain-containing protein [Bacillus cereus]PFI14619.1 transcriptional regulator [Bacillus cereus]